MEVMQSTDAKPTVNCSITEGPPLDLYSDDCLALFQKLNKFIPKGLQYSAVPEKPKKRRHRDSRDSDDDSKNVDHHLMVKLVPEPAKAPAPKPSSPALSPSPPIAKAKEKVKRSATSTTCEAKVAIHHHQHHHPYQSKPISEPLTQSTTPARKGSARPKSQPATAPSNAPSSSQDLAAEQPQPLCQDSQAISSSVESSRPVELPNVAKTFIEEPGKFEATSANGTISSMPPQFDVQALMLYKKALETQIRRDNEIREYYKLKRLRLLKELAPS